MVHQPADLITRQSINDHEANDPPQSGLSQAGAKSRKRSFEVVIPDLPAGSHFHVKVTVGNFERRVKLRVPEASESKRLRFSLDIPEDST